MHGEQFQNNLWMSSRNIIQHLSQFIQVQIFADQLLEAWRSGLKSQSKAGGTGLHHQIDVVGSQKVTTQTIWKMDLDLQLMLYYQLKETDTVLEIKIENVIDKDKAAHPQIVKRLHLGKDIFSRTVYVVAGPQLVAIGAVVRAASCCLNCNGMLDHGLADETVITVMIYQ